MKRSRTRKNQNAEVYTTWRTCISSEAAAQFRRSAKHKPKRTIWKASLLAVGVAIALSLVAQLIAMSQFSTLGYEIERYQERKGEIAEENSALRAAIASCQTTEYYQKKAREFGMKKAESITYLHVSADELAEQQ